MIELCCEFLLVLCIDYVYLSCHTRVKSGSAIYSGLNVKELLAQSKQVV